MGYRGGEGLFQLICKSLVSIGGYRSRGKQEKRRRDIYGKEEGMNEIF